MSDQTGQWTLPARTAIQDPVYAPLLPGQNVPYQSLNAQILDALRYSGTLPGRPVNPFGGNQVDRYKFGGLLGNPFGGTPGGAPGGSPGGPPNGAPGYQPPGGGSTTSDQPNLPPPPNGYQVNTGAPGTFGPKGTSVGPGGGAGPGGGGGLLNPPPSSYTPQTPNANNPFGAGANVDTSTMSQGYRNAMAMPPGPLRDTMMKVYGAALQPDADPNAPVTGGGARPGFQADAQGNYTSQNGAYGYGNSAIMPGSQHGNRFQTVGGGWPPPGPNGEVAARVGPSSYEYLPVNK